RDQYFLLAVLELDQQRVAVIADHGLGYGGVGHAAVGAKIIGPRAFAGAAHRFRKHVHLDRVLDAVRPGHGGGADEGTNLDIGQRDLADADHAYVIGHMQLDVVAAARLHGEYVAIDGLDCAANPRWRRRLLGNGVDRGRRHHRNGDKRTDELKTLNGHGLVSGGG